MELSPKSVAQPVQPQDLGIGRLFWEIREAVVVGDVEAGRIVLWNPAAEALFGYSAAEAVGRPLELLVPERLRKAHRAGLARYRETGRGTILEAAEAIEVPARRRTGEEVPVELTLSPVREAAVSGRFVLALIRDASARRRAQERELELAREQAARAEAEAAVRARDEFLSVAAHELKTPLTVLHTHAQLALRRLGKGEPLERSWAGPAFEAIEHQAGRLGQLIAQLLDIARLESGRLALDPAPVDVVGLVEEAVAAARLLTDRHTLRVQAPARAEASVDALRLEQVLANLLDNAIKFSPEGGPIDVEVSCPSAAVVEVAVRDRGIGVPPERRAGIFEPFYQVHPERLAGGMGLGLHISKQIVDLHGGQLEAEFPEDGGARFVARLPTGTHP